MQEVTTAETRKERYVAMPGLGIKTKGQGQREGLAPSSPTISAEHPRSHV